MTTDYTDFFLKSEKSVIQYDLIEISHSDFSKVYRLVRNAIPSVVVTLETAATATFEYCPMLITPNKSEYNLDFGIRVELGDLGDILPKEIERVIAADGLSEKPAFKYRTYRSDDLTAPMVGPITLQIEEIAANSSGAVFEAKAPSLSINGTGELYSINRFPMLRKFL